MLSLSTIHKNKSVRILKVDCGLGCVRKLQEVGFMIGDVVKVLNNSRGAVIIAKGTLRLGLGRTMGKRILVEELPHGDAKGKKAA